MKKIIPTILLLFVAFFVKAQCVITSTTNISAISPNTCGGVLMVSGPGVVLNINQTTNWTSSGPITLIVTNNALVEWTGNFTFTLAAGSGVILQNGGSFSTANPCNNNKKLFLGTVEIAACTGGGATLYTFAEFNSAGGSPTVTPTAASSTLCGTNSVSLTGNPTGTQLPGISVSYLWTQQSGPATVSFTTANQVNTGINGMSVSGTYVFLLTLTATSSNGSVFNYSKTVTVSRFAPPINQTVTAGAQSMCRGSDNFIRVGATQSGVTYQLLNNSNNSVLQTLPGNGGQIDFPLPYSTQSMTYRVRAFFPANPCTTLLASPITVLPGENPKELSRNLDSKECLVKGNNWVDFVTFERWVVSINPNGQNLGKVTATTFLNTNTIDIPACENPSPFLTTTVMGRRWAITPEFQPVSPVSVRLYFSELEFQELYMTANTNQNTNDDLPFQMISDIVLGKYSNNLNPNVINGIFSDNCVQGASSSLINQGGSGAISTIEPAFDEPVGRFVQFSIPSFSEFWLHGNSNNNVSPLPVTLTKFEAHCKTDHIQINWTTLSETNSDYFLLEKSSNWTEWEVIAVVKASGNSNTQLDYQFTDVNREQGHTYYRLTQFDYDGTKEKFDPVGVYCSSEIQDNYLRVFPNPAENQFTVSVKTEKHESLAEIVIMDLQGKKVYTQVIDLTPGLSEISFNNLSLQAGAYIVQIHSQHVVINPVKLIIR